MSLPVLIRGKYKIVFNSGRSTYPEYFAGVDHSLAIMLSVLLRRRKDLRQKLFVLFAGNVTLFYFFSFLYAWRGEPWFERLALASAVALPQWGLRFFRAFASGSRGMGRLGGVAAALGAILLFAVLYPASLQPAVGPAVLAYVLGFMLVAILNLNVQVKEASSRIDAARIRYLVLGGILSISLQIVDQLDNLMNVEIPPVGLAMTLIYLYIISQTVVRDRLLDLYEMLGRFAVLTLMGVSLALIYTGLVYWAGQAFSINAFLASLVILILLDPLRELVERRISDFFFRERHILAQHVANLRHRLAHVIDLDIMAEVLMDGLTKSRRMTHVGLFLIDVHGRGFDFKAGIGPEPVLTRIEAAVARRHLGRAAPREVLVASDLAGRREQLLQANSVRKARRLKETGELLDRLNADVLIPIQGEEQLHGLVAFRDERLGDPFSSEDADLLLSLAAQLSVTVENSRLYKQTQERDRLAALGQMAAGLAHEIRNPLGSIKGAVQIIEEIGERETREGPEGEFLGVIVEEVDRLNRVVSDFLTYARPSFGRPRLLRVNDILRRTLQLFEANPEVKAEIQVDLANDLPSIQIDGEHLHQVFLNLILNASQAMGEQEYRKLEISTRVRQVRSSGPGRDSRGLPSRSVEIRFVDDGPGIAPNVLKNVFIPFFTTKERGSGLGLALCQRIVRDAGGEIEVRSQPGSGSIFTVVLPSAEEED